MLIYIKNYISNKLIILNIMYIWTFTWGNQRKLKKCLNNFKFITSKNYIKHRSSEIIRAYNIVFTYIFY